MCSNDSTPNPTNQQPQTKKEPTRWVAVSLMPEGNVLGVLYDPNDRTFTLSWVDDDPEWQMPLWIAADNIDLVVKLLEDARDAVNGEDR